MFTGLVQDVGTVEELDRADDGVRLTVSSRLARGLRRGDSVAVNGVCLTATLVHDERFSSDVMNETLARTSLVDAEPGQGVNLELPLRAGDPIGGHIVQGHVDGVGRVIELVGDGLARRMRVQADAETLRYVVEKGSIALDGISLTVAELDSESFTVSLIPETLERTNLAEAEVGRKVNLEVDVLAKYVERLVGTIK
jgi:riboflavin synthase